MRILVPFRNKIPRAMPFFFIGTPKNVLVFDYNKLIEGSMENRKSKSHICLSRDRTSSTTEFLPHTQSLHSKFSYYTTGGAAITAATLPTITSSRPGSSRPMSSRTNILRPMSSRPMSSRPPSVLSQLEMSSRTGIRADINRSSPRNTTRLQSTSPRQRPGSAIRPLSAGVFMRRKEHGWVAKHYPTSQTNLSDDLDELSDCDSLDSFFNEDFDDRDDSEKLGDLLSCNTLGVKSQGHKRDWIPGDSGGQKFHCPRCRDHWHGLTPFPCDEELARLIRDGLWATGNDQIGKTHARRKPGEGTEGDKGGSKKGTYGNGGDSNQQKPKKILKEKTSENESSKPEGGKGKKKERRKITFKLESGDGSNSQDGDQSNTDNDGNGGLRDSTNSTKNTENNSRSFENSDSLDSSTSSSSIAMGPKKKTRGEESEGSLNSLTEADKRKSGGRLLQTRSTKESSFLSDEAGLGLVNSLAGSSRLARNNSSTDHNGAMNGPDKDSDGLATHNSEISNNQNGGHNGESLQEDSTSTETFSTSHSRKNSESGGPDYGKKVRKAGGYMRSSSPTGSEWDDPSHARPYASSTVTSSRTESTSNLDKDRTLPPVIPPIRRRTRKPRADILNGGYEITPAWRYSYFSPSPLHSPANRQTVTTGKRRKK